MAGILLTEKITHDDDLSQYNSFFNPQFLERITPGLDGTAGALQINDSGSLLSYARRDFNIFENSLWGITFLLINNQTTPASNQTTRIISCRNVLGELVLRVNIQKVLTVWNTNIIFRDDNFVEQTYTTQLNEGIILFDLQFTSTSFVIAQPAPQAIYPGIYGTKSGLADFRVGHLATVPPPVSGNIVVDEIKFYINDESITTVSNICVCKNKAVIIKNLILEDED